MRCRASHGREYPESNETIGGCFTIEWLCRGKQGFQCLIRTDVLKKKKKSVSELVDVASLAKFGRVTTYSIQCQMRTMWKTDNPTTPYRLDSLTRPSNAINKRPRPAELWSITDKWLVGTCSPGPPVEDRWSTVHDGWTAARLNYGEHDTRSVNQINCNNQKQELLQSRQPNRLLFLASINSPREQRPLPWQPRKQVHSPDGSYQLNSTLFFLSLLLCFSFLFSSKLQSS